MKQVINSTLGRYMNKVGSENDAATKIPFYVELGYVTSFSSDQNKLN